MKDTNEVLEKIWKQLLAISNINPKFTFQELGGNSIKLLILIEMLNKSFNMTLTVLDIPEILSFQTLNNLIKSKEPVSNE